MKKITRLIAALLLVVSLVIAMTGCAQQIQHIINQFVGDSDNTPELNKIKTDFLLVPIGGTYTMTIEEAARLANNIKPKKVIPTHYGEIVGEKDFGEKFEKLIDGDIVCELLI